MSRKDYEEKYTDPGLRERLKEEIKKSGKGGKKGQWSARKSQLLVKEYEKAGGGYRKDNNKEEAASLIEWTDQDWQTIDDAPRARKNGKTRRYLPQKVWKKLPDREKEKVNRMKEEASREGTQKVPWTPAVKKAFKEAGYSEKGHKVKKADWYIKAKELNIKGRSKMKLNELKEAVGKAL
ncbi:hypothetical protein RCC89_06205 [Cytophagaceae bacterium ABcell3]|nr:hypothetical protein RCC89_06205 [Cytophagaceae bacterium ABcell3]